MRVFAVSYLILFLHLIGYAQKGTAPPGYYPSGYSGDTFTGNVVAAEEHKLTLEYTNKAKTEQFTGITTAPCAAPLSKDVRTAKELHLTAIPIGSNITVLYSTKKIKREDGSKEEVHIVIGFAFNELNGKKLSNPPLIPCASGGPFTGFQQ